MGGGEKPAKQFLQKNTISPSKKCWDKNRRKKCQKTFFFHTNIINKKWGKNARNNFYRSTRIERAKNFGKKLFEKSAKKRFLYSHEYHAQKMGGKTREIIFLETHK